MNYINEPMSILDFIVERKGVCQLKYSVCV